MNVMGRNGYSEEGNQESAKPFFLEGFSNLTYAVGCGVFCVTVPQRNSGNLSTPVTSKKGCLATGHHHFASFSWRIQLTSDKSYKRTDYSRSVHISSAKPNSPLKISRSKSGSN